MTVIEVVHGIAQEKFFICGIRLEFPQRLSEMQCKCWKKVFDRWLKLKNSSARRTDTQAANEKKFENNIKNMFDVTNADAMKLIKIFLVDQ